MGQGEGSGEGTGSGSGVGVGRGLGRGLKDGCLFGGICCIIILVILLVLGLVGLAITKIVMGAVYIDDCPKEKLIPIYLIVSGVCTFLNFGLYNFKPKSDEEKDPTAGGKTSSTIIRIIFLIAFIFYIIWLICGSVWVFPHFADIVDGCPGEVDCCEKKLAKFALAMLIIDWIFIALLIVGIVVTVVIGICLNNTIGGIENSNSKDNEATS